MNPNHNPAALVTGSAIRLGKHIALALAEKGYDIAIHYNSSIAPAEETAELIRQKGRNCALFPYNLQDASGLMGFMEQVATKFPHLSVLVNSASGYTQATIADTTPDIFDTQFALNLKAPFFLTQAFAKVVQKGNVINILDNKIGFNQYQYAAYLLAKKGLMEFTKMAAIEFAPHIRVNGVAPGVVLPASSRSEEYIQWRLQSIPLRMQGSTEHITKTVLHFLDNDFITGQFISVDGGENIAQIGRNAGEFDPSKV
jgi:NAD(P)-dependent dehydrogenase (short-subunit alcohol dehydrogenase family)